MKLENGHNSIKYDKSKYIFKIIFEKKIRLNP